jgi:hypothetical protein
MLCNQLKSHVLPWKSKIILYKTLISPVLTWASETWVLSTSGVKVIAVFEKKVLRSVYGPIRDDNECRITYNYGLYALYEDLDIITFIKLGRL